MLLFGIHNLPNVTSLFSKCLRDQRSKLYSKYCSKKKKVFKGKYFEGIAWNCTNTVQPLTCHQIVALVQILPKCSLFSINGYRCEIVANELIPWSLLQRTFTLSLFGCELDDLAGCSALGTEVHLLCSVTPVWSYSWLGFYHQVLTKLHFDLRDLEETKTKL